MHRGGGVTRRTNKNKYDSGFDAEQIEGVLYILGSSYNTIKTRMLHRHIGFEGTNFTVASNLTANINVSK